MSWNTNTFNGIAGYILYYGTNSGVYAHTNRNGLKTDITVTNLQAGRTYYFVVTDYNTSGWESLRSTQVSYTISNTAPTNPVITWSNPANLVYGAPLAANQLSATANVPGSFVYSPPAGAVLMAGNVQTLSATFTPADTTNYNVVAKTVTVNILLAPLTITANNNSKVFGAALPILTASYTGLVNGDTAASLGTAVTLSTTATGSSTVGAYTIAASGAVGTNYTIAYVNGALTVNSAALTITAANTNKVYGAALPALTASYTGFVNGDTAASLGTAVTLSTTALASSPVGAYTIAASGIAGTNYTITYVNGALTVTTAALTITAADTNKVYGAALPALTASYTGFVNGDIAASLGTPVTLSTTALASSPVGAYTITASGAVGTNYSITPVDGTLAVTAANITVTVDDKAKVFGAALPAFTATYSGFVLGDSTNDPAFLAAFTTSATATSDVGTYAITASGATNANYIFNQVAGVLTITPSFTSGVVGSSANPSLPGTNVTFTMTLSVVAPGAGTPSGTVNFRIDGSVAASGALSGGVATFTASNLALNSHTVTAEYAGDLNFLGATNALAQRQVIDTPPVAGDVTIGRHPAQGVKVLLTTLLASGSNPDGGTLNIVVSSNSASGATISETGGWVFYTPPIGFTNADSFSYVIGDNNGMQATGSALIAPEADLEPSQNMVAIVDLGSNTYSIEFLGIPARVYTIQYTTDLETPDWQPLGTETADATGSFRYIDTLDQGSPPRFYRSIYP